MQQSRFVVAAVALFLCSSSFAHVFWLQPSAFTLQTGEIVKVQLRVGDAFPGDSLPRDEQRIVRFGLLAPGDDTPHPIVGRDGRDPAGLVKVASAGTYVLTYQSTPSPVTLTAEKFESYLKEKGLEKIIDERAKAGESDKPAREVFSRCAKAIVRVAGAANDTDDDTDSTSCDTTLRFTGLRFEIIALAAPVPRTAEGTFPIRLMFEGKPLVNALVEGRSPVPGSAVVRVRTNEKGEATLTLTTPGMWVIDSVEMVRASKELNADWESMWASLCIYVKDSNPSSDSTIRDTPTKVPPDEPGNSSASSAPRVTTREDRR